MPIHSFAGITPEIADDVFIAPGAQVIGNVRIGAGSSIFYNCVLRGDIHSITIGERTNIQDGTVIHVTTNTHATVIGNDCLIGHMAMLHGCTLLDHAFVGLGSIVMDGCTIESDGMLAAGALLTPGKRIAAGQLWTGRPAAYARDRRPDEIARNRSGCAGYVEVARRHRASVGA